MVAKQGGVKPRILPIWPKWLRNKGGKTHGTPLMMTAPEKNWALGWSSLQKMLLRLKNSTFLICNQLPYRHRRREQCYIAAVCMSCCSDAISVKRIPRFFAGRPTPSRRDPNPLLRKSPANHGAWKTFPLSNCYEGAPSRCGCPWSGAQPLPSAPPAGSPSPPPPRCLPTNRGGQGLAGGYQGISEMKSQAPATLGSRLKSGGKICKSNIFYTHVHETSTPELRVKIQI